jgi:hypothetical protein
VLYGRRSSYARALDALLTPFDQHPVLARTEANRGELFMAMVGKARQADRERLAREGAERTREELERAHESSLAAAQELETELRELRGRHDAVMRSRLMRWSRPARRLWYRLK